MADDPTPDPKPGDDPKPDPKPEPKADAKPPWGDDFDPERAWRTITEQREENKRLKGERDEARGKVQEYERANESASEKAEREKAEALERASKAESTALRLEVAIDKAPEGMSLAQVRKLAKRLSGSTKAELEADADELFSDFAPSEGDDDPEPKRRPRERLRPGAVPGAEPEKDDPASLASAVPRGW